MVSKSPNQSSLFGFDNSSQPTEGDLPAEKPEQIGQTTITYTPAREILTKATGFMDAYDFTLNPYSGCSFGCTYCYAAFFSRNAEKLNTWGQWLTVKENAIQLLQKRQPGSLNNKRIYMSSVTDPYQPAERQLKLTRGLLQTIADRADQPKLVIQTRSPDVVRDCDLFHQIAQNGGQIQINMTITTDDEDLRRTFEPHCPANPARLHAIAQIHANHIPACITMTPLLLVANPQTFADQLLETGVQKFIAQPFHFQKGKFLAATRDQALNLMTEKLQCDPNSFKTQYLLHYDHAFSILRQKLPHLGEGKTGFEPPF